MPGFTSDPLSGRFRDSAGRYVSDAALRRALDQVLAAQTSAARDLTQQMLDGTIALAVWQARSMELVKSVHLIAAALAHGGWNNLSQSDFGWIGSQIRPQYQYLSNFANELASGAQPMNGTVLVRISMYIGAGRQTYSDAQRRIASRRTVSEERRVLGVADHCATCLQQAKLNWQPFGTLRRIGDSECRTNCRCAFQFRAA